MGKKLTEASLKKISKNHKQQQFSSMAKALRPKVYITHSSRFKKLVQDLTGNNNITATSTTTTTTTTMSSSSSSSSPTPKPSRVDVQITDHHLETSFDSSEASALSSSSSEATATITTTSSYSSSEFCFYNQTCLEDDTTLLGSSEEANQCIMDGRMLAYENLESVLFDAEVVQSFLYDYCHAEPEEQEVRTYECELWGLL